MRMVTKLRWVRDVVALGWTRQAAARDGAGIPVYPAAREAVCWCLYGAAVRVSEAVGDGDGGDAILDAMSAAVIRYYGVDAAPYWRSAVAWNDDEGRTQADVLAFMDRIIGEYETAA